MHEIEIEPLSLVNLTTTQESGLDFVPTKFEDYLGQENLKQKLQIYTQAAKERGEPLDHLLLFGPPGVGKTTLAQIMAHVMGVNIKICSGPLLERTGDLVALLSGLEPRDIFFIDEIHRLPANVEEILYSAMEQFKVEVIIGQGVGAKAITLPVSPFTLLGATTKAGMISAPLRSRFGIIERIDFYTEEELEHIVTQASGYLGVDLPRDSAQALARSARGTPRIAKKLVRRVRDFAQVYKKQPDIEFVLQALQWLGIDKEGLSAVDLLLLEKIITHFNGGPVGLETLAALIGEDAATIETVYEPFLMRKGYLEKTPRGRQIPYKAIPYLKSKFLGQATCI